jgi:hypothetical protein
MVWTNEKIRQLPEVYRDFMLILKPVIDSRKPGTVLRITGIPFGMLVDYLTAKHEYDTAKVRRLADNLRRDEYIVEDTLGFFQPTGKGESLILALSGSESDDEVPPLPSLME